MHGSLTTKGLKKKHSSRPVGGAETGSGGGEDSQKGRAWWIQRGGGLWIGWSHICVQINWEEKLGSETDSETQGSNVGK